MKIVDRDLGGFVETFTQELEFHDEPDGHTKDQSRAFTKRVKARAARLEEHIGKTMKLDRQWKKFDDRLCTDELNELKRKYDTLLDDFKKLHCIVQCMYSDKDEQDVIISAFHASVASHTRMPMPRSICGLRQITTCATRSLRSSQKSSLRTL